MQELLNTKIQKIISLTTNDKRWDIKNETMFQVFGFTLSGFAFGVGKNLCFLDAKEIAASVTSELTKLGAGEKYVERLVASAFKTFENETKSFQSDLVGIGYSQSLSKDLEELKEAMFSNTAIIEQHSVSENNATNPPQKKSKKWWRFGR